MPVFILFAAFTLKLEKKRGFDLTAYIENTLQGIEENPTVFTNPQPSVTMVRGKNDAYETTLHDIIAARTHLSNLVTLGEQQEKDLKGFFTALTGHVESLLPTHLDAGELARLTKRKKGQPQGKPAKVDIGEAIAGQQPGEVKLLFTPLPTGVATHNEVRWRIIDEQPPVWHDYDTENAEVGRGSLTMQGFPSGKKLRFEIRGVRGRFKGYWSDGAEVMVP